MRYHNYPDSKPPCKNGVKALNIKRYYNVEVWDKIATKAFSSNDKNRLVTEILPKELERQNAFRLFEYTFWDLRTEAGVHKGPKWSSVRKQRSLRDELR